MTLNPDQQNVNAARIDANAHGYSNTWEQFHSARVQEVGPGRHTIRVEKRSHNDGVTGLAGFGMQGFWMRKDAGVQAAKCRASPSSWYYSRRTPMCTLPFTTSVPSVVAASFGGHGRSNHVYVAVSVDGENPNQSVPGRLNTMNLLTHSCKLNYLLRCQRDFYLPPRRAVNCRLHLASMPLRRGGSHQPLISETL